MTDQRIGSNSEARHIVRTFGWASFLHDVGADMVFSVWPLFLTQVLKANMTAIGIVDGVGEAVVSLSQALSGYLSDRLQKRKVFVWLGYFFGSIARIGYVLAPSWPWLIPFRLLDRSGKIRSTPRDAMVSDVSVRENRGRHFGFLRLMDNSGAVVGIILAIILIRVLDVRTIFLIAALPSIFAVLLVIVAVKDRRTGDGLFHGIHLRDISSNLRRYILATACFELGAFSYSFLLLAGAARSVPTTNIPVLYLLFTAVAAAASLPAGRLADRIGRKPVLLFAFIAWGGVCLMVLMLPHLFAFLGAVALYGVHKGMLDPVQKAFAAELAAPHLVASTLGGFQLVIGLCSLPASFMAGLLWDQFGMTMPFALSLILTFVAVCILFSVREK